MLESLLPQIQKLIAEKATGVLKTQGEKAIFQGVYTVLPSPVRLFVKEDAFVDFCITNSHKLFPEKASSKKSGKKSAAKIAKKATVKATKKVIKKSTKK